MSHKLSVHPSADQLESFLTGLGGTDQGYLQAHWLRFVETKSEVMSTWERQRGNRLLDVGGHWLHQAALYAVDGFKVTSVDLAATFELPHVQAQAAALGIELHIETNLEHPQVLSQLPEDSFDLILFSEIIEHITFNPVAMWSTLYRLLAPNGRIVVTTPNYYAARGRLWDFKRFMSGNGGGLPIREVMDYHTYGHHWKEYSAKELIEYFYRVSPDFVTTKALHRHAFHERQFGPPPGPVTRFLENRFPILRPNLHMEIDLLDKKHGILAKPGWA